MLIKTKLSQEDYIRGNFVLLYSKISVLIFTGIIVLVLLAMILAAIILPDFSITQIMFPLLMLIAFPMATFFSAKRNYSANPMTGETIEYRFERDYFSVKGETFDSQIPWNRIHKVTLKKNWLLVWQNFQNANPIPRKDISQTDLALIRQILNDQNVKNNL